MKTEKILERDMHGLKVYQRISDGYFDATSLLNQWNDSGIGKRKRMALYKENKSYIELSQELENEATNSHDRKNDLGFKALIEIKGKNTRNGKTPDQVWMHPFLFIDFAMWLNTRFKLQVIKFVYDQLVQNRHNAGDSHLDFHSKVAWLSSVNGKTPDAFMHAAFSRAINYVVFNQHYAGIRDTATETQLGEIADIHAFIRQSIDNTTISSVDHALEVLRVMWTNKYAK